MWVTRVGIKPGALRFGQNDLPQKPPAKEGEYLEKDEPDPKSHQSREQKGREELLRRAKALEPLLDFEEFLNGIDPGRKERMDAEKAAEAARLEKAKQNLEATQLRLREMDAQNAQAAQPAKEAPWLLRNLVGSLKFGVFAGLTFATLGLVFHPLLLAAPIIGAGAAGLVFCQSIFAKLLWG